MKTRGRRFDFFLKDMEEALGRILHYSEGLDYFGFSENLLVRDAIIRNFEILGECVKHIPFSFQKKYKQLPWQHMFALRNFIVHEYFDVDDEILWAIIEHDIRRNAEELQFILKTWQDQPR